MSHVRTTRHTQPTRLETLPETPTPTTHEARLRDVSLDTHTQRVAAHEIDYTLSPFGGLR